MGVMNVKRGTQSFSKAQQTSSMKSDAASGAGQTSGAQEFQKAFGDQDMGEVLNKVADPNFVDPKHRLRGVGNPEMGKDAFMKMMLAQMKNQDPTNPTPSHEMAAQLAQFTSLESLNNINSTLEAMKSAQAPSTNFQALAFIGKRVSGDSSKITRAAGDTKHTANFQLMNDAMSVKVTVKDTGGNVVRKLDFGQMKKGDNSIEWNGIDDKGMPARAGEYKITVEGVGSNGAKVFAKTSFSGRITGLNYSSEGPVLLVGDQSIKMSDVKKIEDVGPEENGAAAPLGAGAAAIQASQQKAMQAMAPMKPLPVKPEATSLDAKSPVMQKKMGEGATPKVVVDANGGISTGEKRVVTDQELNPSDDQIPPAPDVDPIAQGNIADIPMAQGMIDSLAKAH